MTGKTTYTKIYLPAPTEISAGGYTPWAEDAVLCRALNIKDTKFAAPVAISLQVSTRFKGDLLMLLLWVQRFLNEHKVISDASPIVAITADFTNDCSDIAICLWDVTKAMQQINEGEEIAA